MRINIRSSSRRHVRRHIGTWRVFFNNRDITHITQYVDTRAGVARVLVMGEDQHSVLVDPHSPDRAWVQEWHGQIRLRRRPAKQYRGSRGRRVSQNLG